MLHQLTQWGRVPQGPVSEARVPTNHGRCAGEKRFAAPTNPPQRGREENFVLLLKQNYCTPCPPQRWRKEILVSSKTELLYPSTLLKDGRKELEEEKNEKRDKGSNSRIPLKHSPLFLTYLKPFDLSAAYSYYGASTHPSSEPHSPSALLSRNSFLARAQTV